MVVVVTIAIYWIGASYALALVLALDQLRRPLPAWEAADRNRRFWVTLSLTMGFHGLGQYAAAAYLVGVVPRFRAAEHRGPRRTLQHASATIMGRWQRVARHLPAARADTALEATALVAAMLMFVSSCIHAAQIAGHFEQYWLYGAFFFVSACLQALWAALVWREPLHRRVLVAGALGNAALIAVWAISRTVGVPGPQAWQPESVGVVDVLSKLDELAVIVLVAVIVRRLRAPRNATISPLQLRLAAALAGPLFLYSMLAAIGGGHHH